MMFPLSCPIAFPHRIHFLPILDQGKIYAPTNREAIWTALGGAHCPLEHWLNLSSIDGSGFVGITPSPLEAIVSFLWWVNPASQQKHCPGSSAGPQSISFCPKTI